MPAAARSSIESGDIEIGFPGQEDSGVYTEGITVAAGQTVNFGRFVTVNAAGAARQGNELVRGIAVPLNYSSSGATASAGDNIGVAYKGIYWVSATTTNAPGVRGATNNITTGGQISTGTGKLTNGIEVLRVDGDRALVRLDGSPTFSAA